jgi:hypothetical protein
MKKNTAINAFLLAAFLALVGCRTAPIYNVEHTPVHLNKAKYSLGDVEKAIIRAGAGLGWQMDKVKPGLINGTLYLRDHVAKVTIPYSTQEYSIEYQDSQNLNYKPAEANKPRQIHKNYNSWIENLDQAIKTQLLAQE